MANHALARVEAALRARNLDRTLSTWRPAPLSAEARSAKAGPYGTPPAADAAPTGVASFDAALGGGLPRGQLSEIAGARSSGRATLVLQLIAAATRRGEIAALVDPFDQFDVASAAAADVDLDRLLWIRGGGPPDRAVERALKALTLVLQAGGFGVVAIDLADASPAALGTIPFTTWLRVQRIIEGRDTACVIAGPRPLGRSAGGLTLMLEARPRWRSWLTGFDLAVRVVSSRRQVEGGIAMGAHVR